jgi:uncharacterized membrane protein YraQ (UPF0718 family)
VSAKPRSPGTRRGGLRFGRGEAVFAALALGGGVWCWRIGGPELVGTALGEAGTMILMVLPQLVAGLLLGSLLARVIGRERIARTLGEGSGLRGLLLASSLGAITPGGRFTSFPLIHALWIAGADAGTLMAFLTGWALIGINRIIVWELPLMGADLTLIRVLVSLPMPILVGLAARWLAQSPRLALRRGPAE